MKMKSFFPILWLPLIGFWTFLFVILGNSPKDLEGVIPLGAYLLVSFLLVLQLQLVIADKRDGFFIKFGTVNLLLISLSISSISILLHFTHVINQASLFFIIGPLVSNAIIAELFSSSTKYATNKKQAWSNRNKELGALQENVSKENAMERNQSLEYREAWSKYFSKASLDYLDVRDVEIELTRLKGIVQYSSYFRSIDSLQTLSKLESNLKESELIYLLKSIK